MKFKTIEWRGDRVRLLDQRALPQKVCFFDCKDVSSVAHAIRNMVVRGAPAIGVVAAMGITLAAKKIRSNRPEVFHKKLREVCDRIEQTRPTAVNLFWAVDRMRKIIGQAPSLGIESTKKRLEEEALRIHEEDVKMNRKIGKNGKILIKNGDGVLTHCNAGALATAGYGTALGVIRAAWKEGKRFQVFVDETRPMLQGARLTAWELVQEKIPATVLADNMSAWLMERGKINLVLVGADRIARNGDTANKIGTYGLAILSKWHHIPFYVAAPTSTVDIALTSGESIPIEERPSEEVTHFGGKRITPEGIKVINPAFDITPHFFIQGIITEKGIIQRPFKRELRRIMSRG